MINKYEILYHIVNGTHVPSDVIEETLIQIHTRIREQLTYSKGLDATFEERVSTMTELILNRDFEEARKFVGLPLRYLLPRSLNTIFELNMRSSGQSDSYNCACKLLNAAILGVEEERSLNLFMTFYALYEEATQGREIGRLPKEFAQCNDILESFYVLSKQLRIVGKLA